MFDPTRVDALYASNPSIPQQEMAAIAANRPDLHAALASNPALYPELRAWLATSPNPQVQQALRDFAARSQSFAPQAPAMGGAPQAAAMGGAPQASSNKKVAIIAGSAVAALVVVAGGALAVGALMGGGGKNSAQDVASAFDEGIANNNLISLYTLIAPSERDTVIPLKDLSTKGFDAEELFGSSALADYASAITVNSSQMTYTVTNQSADIATIDITDWQIDATVNAGEFSDSLRTRYMKATSATSLTDAEEDLFTSIADEGEENITEDLVDSDNVMRLVAVKEKGDWYLSPSMSMAEAELAASWSPKTPDYTAAYTDMKGATSPEAAVQELVEAARVSSNTATDAAVLSLLPLPERRVAAVYGDALEQVDDGASALSDTANDLMIHWDLKSTTVDGGAIVSLGATSIDVDDAVISFDGAKMTVSADGRSVETDLGRGLENPERIGVFTVKEDGTWRVSMSGTALNLFTLHASDDALAEAITGISDLIAQLDGDTDEIRDFEAIAERIPPVGALTVVGWNLWNDFSDAFGGDVSGLVPGVSSTPSTTLQPTMSASDMQQLAGRCSADDLRACDDLYWGIYMDEDNQYYDLVDQCNGKGIAGDGGFCDLLYGD